MNLANLQDILDESPFVVVKNLVIYRNKAKNGISGYSKNNNRVKTSFFFDKLKTNLYICIRFQQIH